MITAIGAVWLLVGAASALVFGRGVRIADEREGLRPARMDPRAAQYAEQAQQRVARAAPGVFTAVLLVLVLVGVGIAQQSFGGAA